MACLSLHNNLMQTDNAMHTPTGFIDSENRDGKILPGEWRNQMTGHDGNWLYLKHLINTSFQILGISFKNVQRS